MTDTMRILLIGDCGLMALKVARDYMRHDMHSGRTAGRHNAAIVTHRDGRHWLVWHNAAKTQVTVKYIDKELEG